MAKGESPVRGETFILVDDKQPLPNVDTTNGKCFVPKTPILRYIVFFVAYLGVQFSPLLLPLETSLPASANLQSAELPKGNVLATSIYRAESSIPHDIHTNQVQGTARCKSTVEFSIGHIDAGYKITPMEAEVDALAAAAIWNRASGAQRIVYKEDADLKINFKYGETQRNFDNTAGLRETLQVKDEQFRLMEAALSLRSAAYEADLAKYDTAITTYNDSVDSWNLNGGAPDYVISQTRAEKDSLHSESARLEAEREGINFDISQRNKVLSDYGSILRSYRMFAVEDGEEKIGEYREDPFSPPVITILSDISEEQVRYTIAHELGHALGLDHVSDEYSVMSVIIPSDLKVQPELSPADRKNLDGCK